MTSEWEGEKSLGRFLYDSVGQQHKPRNVQWGKATTHMYVLKPLKGKI